MADKYAMLLGKRMFKKGLGKKFQEQDDYASYTYQKVDGHGRQLTKKKDLDYYTERGVPEKDAKILLQVKKRAKWLDSGMNFGGMKFGVSTFIEFIPAVGDFAGTGLAYLLVIRKAESVSKGPDIMVLKKVMYRNLTIDFFMGLTPFLGDIADTIFRCNIKNATALEEMLMKRARKVGEIGRDAEKAARAPIHNHADVDGYYDSELAPTLPPRYEDGHSGRDSGHHRQYVESDHTRTKTGRGWLRGFDGRGGREHDFERNENVAPPQPPRKDNSRFRNDSHRNFV